MPIWTRVWIVIKDIPLMDKMVNLNVKKIQLVNLVSHIVKLLKHVKNVVTEITILTVKNVFLVLQDKSRHKKILVNVWNVLSTNSPISVFVLLVKMEQTLEEKMVKQNVKIAQRINILFQELVLFVLKILINHWLEKDNVFHVIKELYGNKEIFVLQ